MLTIEPGTHGSTYGGNPLGSAIAIRALEIIRDEGMVERAEKLGRIFREGLEAIKSKSPVIQTVRGKGLLNAIVIDESKTGGHTAWDLCLLMKDKGLLVSCPGQALEPFIPPIPVFFFFSFLALAFLPGDESRLTVCMQAKPTHQNIIRLAPPLVITEQEIETALKVIEEAVNELPGLGGEKEDKVIPPPEKKVKIGVEA